MVAVERIEAIADHLRPQARFKYRGDVSGLFSQFRLKDPTEIQPRSFAYGRHYCREYASATFAPGGLGKTALSVAEVCAMVSGKPLLGIAPRVPLRVWFYNGEDPRDEADRRFAAAAIEYGLTTEDFGDRLFIGSGRDHQLVMATEVNGLTIHQPNVDAVIEHMIERRIDVAIIDPFVSTHQVTENDNNAIDAVAKTWAKIAGETYSAIDLVHHTRKTNGAEITVEDGRGAGALLAAVRSARVLNPMSADEAERAGVENRHPYFKVSSGKANLAPRSEKSDWYRFVSVCLDNGIEDYEDADGFHPGDEADHIGVVKSWSWPNALDGLTAHTLLDVQKAVSAGDWRESSQASDWVGLPVAEVLQLNISKKQDAGRIKSLLATWLGSGALKVEQVKDVKKGRLVPYVRVGEWVQP